MTTMAQNTEAVIILNGNDKMTFNTIGNRIAQKTDRL